jgi:diguanylate cyclase (GGDEF)-like protein/PAS domain S-box-containing protein
MTRPDTDNLLEELAAAGSFLRKSVLLKVSCIRDLQVALHLRLRRTGKYAFPAIIMILVLSCLCVQALGGDVRDPLKLNLKTPGYNLAGHLEIYEDETGAADIDSVESKKFVPSNKAVPNFGFTTSAFWIKFAVKNTTSQAQTLFLQIANHYLDFVDIFVKSDRRSAVEHYRGGARVPFDDRTAGERQPLLQLVFGPGETETILLRVKSATPLRVPMVLSTEESYRHDELKRYMLLGLFYGVLGFLIIYNIFGWSILKQRAYFYYILLLVGLAAWQLSYDDLVPHVTIFHQPERLLHLFNSGIGLTFFFNTLFVCSFMDARTKYPILYRVLDVFLALAMIVAVVFTANFYMGNHLLMIYGPSLAWALAITTGLMLYKGESQARYLFLAHVQFPVLGTIQVLMLIGFLPFAFVWAQALKFAYLWQAMFLSLALADRYSIMQRNFQHVLEDKVTERSAELVEANENLHREILERKRGEKAIERAKRDWEETFDTVPDLIAIIDRNHVIQRLNKAMADKLKLHPKDAIGRNCYEFCHGADRPFPGCPLLQSLADGVEHSAEVDEPILGGTFLVSVTPMEGNNHQPNRFVHVARDITERKNFEERLRRLATTDSLTEIWNRRHFELLAKGELERAKRYGGDLALMMIDLDHFKIINDTYGHAVGDEVLQMVATIGRTTLRSIDLFARYGGDEFAVALPETPLERAIQVAERLRQTFCDTPASAETESLYVTASIGITVTDQGSVDFKTLVKQADEALYEAKSNGRNCVKVFQR